MRIGRRDEAIYTRAVIVIVVLFWVSLAALAWTHVLYPRRRDRARAGRAAAGSRRGRRADGHRDRRRLQRGDGDRAAAREPARARLPARQAADRRHLRRVVRPHRGDRAAVPRRAGGLEPARRQGRRAGPRGPRRPTARSSRSPTRTRPGRPTRCARSSRPFADPDVAYVCGQLRILGADGANQEGVYWRYEMGVRGAESRLGSVTGGNGSIYAVRRVGLRRGRSALRPRPLAAVPDGAARPARGLRARRARAGRSRRRRTRPSTAARCACSSTAG